MPHVARVGRNYRTKSRRNKKNSANVCTVILHLKEKKALLSAQALYGGNLRFDLLFSVKVDFDELKQKLMVDVSSRSMHDLCHKRTTNEEPVVKFFELSAKTKRMMQRLHLLHKSDIFLSFWNSCFDRAATLFKDDHGSSETFTIENVQEHVWITSYQRWRKLWERVISGEISIKEVEERFQKFWEDTKALDVEMEMAVTCFPEEDIYVSLQSRFHQIKQCHQLTECLDAAEMISEFKDEMGLDGDFHVLDHLREQVNENT